MKTFRWKVKPGMDVTSAPSVREVRFGDGYSPVSYTHLDVYKRQALMGEDYQDIFRQQVRESAEREKAGLSRPVWIAQALSLIHI